MKVSTSQVWAQNIVLKINIVLLWVQCSHRKYYFLQNISFTKNIPFFISDILANRDEGNQSNSQTQRDPIRKAIGK